LFILLPFLTSKNETVSIIEEIKLQAYDWAINEGTKGWCGFGLGRPDCTRPRKL
jgi:hypothetical protein